MKLIIDIEPRYYKNMRSEVKELYYEAINRITEAISNGIPYEERPTINCKDCDGYEAGYSAGLKDAERPQGEWVEAEITEEYRQYGFDLRVVCSRCGSEQSYFDFNEYHEPIAVTYIRSRFCSYCGAKMIKDFTGEAIP